MTDLLAVYDLPKLATEMGKPNRVLSKTVAGAGGSAATRTGEVLDSR
jgi:hypothetical protein